MASPGRSGRCGLSRSPGCLGSRWAGQTKRLANWCALMVDRRFAMTKMSLLPGETRPAVVLSLDFSTVIHWMEEHAELTSGASQSCRIRTSKISFARIPREKAQTFAQDTVALASVLWRRRVARGLPDWDSGFDEAGRIVRNQVGRPGSDGAARNNGGRPSHWLALVAASGYPMIYRNQGGSAGGRGGRYEVVSRGHKALGIDHYGQFTSPIRRYVDLVNQRVLLAAIAGDQLYTVTEISEFCAAGNRAAQQSSVVQRQHAWLSRQKRERPLIERLDPDGFSILLSSQADDRSEVVVEAERRLADGMLSPVDIAVLASTQGPRCADV